METFQNLLEESIHHQLSTPRALTKITVRKLEECGVTLSEAQQADLLKQYGAGHYDIFGIDFTEEQEEQLERHFGGSSRILSFSEQDAERYIQDMLKKYEEAFPDLLSSSGERLLTAFKKEAPKALKQRGQDEKQYNKLIQKHWGEPLRLLEILLSVCLEAGSDFNATYRSQAAEENDYVFEALTRLHARGCQVGFEILTLLKYGFAEGAYARWRTLHELTVIAGFIKNRGNGVAERYLYHRIISDYKDALDYQKHCNKLGWQPIPEAEIDALKTAHDSLIARYGKEFRSTYGWAAQTLGDKQPKFKDLETEVNLEHARPLYLLGNLNVHASSKSVQFRLGSPPKGDEILVAGPSYFGLSEPGQATAWTINQLTGALLLTRPNLDHLAFSTASTNLVNEVYQAFDEANENLISDENRERIEDRPESYDE